MTGRGADDIGGPTLVRRLRTLLPPWFFAWQHRVVDARVTQLGREGAVPPLYVSALWPALPTREPARMSARGLPIARRGGFFHARVEVRSYYTWVQGANRLRVMMTNHTSRRGASWTAETRARQVREFLFRAGPHPVLLDDSGTSQTGNHVVKAHLRHSSPADSDWVTCTFRIDGRERSFELVVLEEDWLALGAVGHLYVAIEGHGIDPSGLELVTTE